MPHKRHSAATFRMWDGLHKAKHYQRFVLIQLTPDNEQHQIQPQSKRTNQHPHTNWGNVFTHSLPNSIQTHFWRGLKDIQSLFWFLFSVHLINHHSLNLPLMHSLVPRTAIFYYTVENLLLTKPPTHGSENSHAYSSLPLSLVLRTAMFYNFTQ